jgi:hypothetical protein
MVDMRIDILGQIITFAGLASFGVALIIILLGKKVGSDRAGPQRITVGKYVELNTSSVITLTIITLVPVFGPLALAYWRPDLKDYVPREELAKSYLKIQDLSLIIHGAVLLDTGGFANDVQITAVRTRPGASDTLRDQTDEQGQFYIELEGARPKEHYDISWSKAGYTKKTLRFGFNELPFPLVLSRQGAEQ